MSAHQGLLAVCLLVTGSAVLASDYEPQPWYTDSGLAITPELGLTSGYDDNLTYSPDDPLDSWFNIVAPMVAVRTGHNLRYSELSYSGRYGRYVDSSNDDYNDHNGQFKSHYELSARQRLGGSYTFSRGHEARGDGLSEGIGNTIAEPLRTEEQRLRLSYGLGARSSRHNLELSGAWSTLDYLNYREFTARRDREQWLANMVFSRRHSARFAWVADVRGLWTSYPQDEQEISSDNRSTRLLFGGKWEIANLLDGRATAGVEHKDFDDSRRDNFRGFTWDVSLDWQPSTLHRLQLSTGREAKEPNNFGDYVLESTAQLQWRYQLRPLWSLDMGGGYTERAYTGVNRTDDLWQASLGTTYDFRRWLSLSLGWAVVDQQSNIDLLSYDKQLLWLNIKITR